MARVGQDFDVVLAAARLGESWAFQRLFGSVAAPLAGYLRGHGCQDVDGVANDVLLGAFRGFDRFVGNEDQFRSWLFTIAHRRLVDERRARTRRPQPAPLADREPTGGDAEDDALALLGDRRVVDLLRRLTDDQREVLLLRVVADLSVDETARLLRKQVTAVKALQRRALDALRREMSNEAVSR